MCDSTVYLDRKVQRVVFVIGENKAGGFEAKVGEVELSRLGS